MDEINTNNIQKGEQKGYGPSLLPSLRPPTTAKVPKLRPTFTGPFETIGVEFSGPVLCKK